MMSANFRSGWALTGKAGKRSVFRFVITLLVATLLVACNTTDLLKDQDYNPRVTWGRHVVSSGETLYSIAMRYGWNYRELASANDIDPPYNIRPGDVIRFDREPDSRSSPAVAGPPSSTASAASGSTATSGRESSPSSDAASSPSAKSDDRRNKELQASKKVESKIGWQWPHVGPIIAKFSSDSTDMNKGIDIGGDVGDPILAAADGQVVYAGSGLLGYGNLIIVNHSEHYLSAYAHNRTILVDEGEQVGQGQQIAELGDTGANRAKLHFEIRRNGDPVDPLDYLPQR